MSADQPNEALEEVPVDNGCINGCSAPFGVRCSVCNTEKRQPSMILCQCANHHRWFGWPNVVNVCLTCSGAAVNEYVMPVRRSGNVGDHLDQVLQARLSVECCCTAENGGTYCGQPECDIYYCHDCGDEFSEPCPRHEGVDHV